MMKHVCILILMFVFCTSCKEQNKSDQPKNNVKHETKKIITYHGPNHITRNIIQDRNGNIWMASWDGVFRYDGKSFINITSKISSARFFSVLEDREGNLWFGSIGSGVYFYNGKTFRNYTTKEGLAGNEVTCIYEDKTGKIWFGTTGGASRYDGQSFRNFTTKDGLPSNEVNSIIEDKTGKFWFGTRDCASVYDGKTFVTLTNMGKPFTNVRTIIKDKTGNIWLGGNDGIWRYDGKTFTNFTHKFVGYIYEDKKGNIWTSSLKGNVWNRSLTTYGQVWTLSRYNVETLLNNKPTITEIKSGEGMIFGILEDYDGNIWFGTLNGVCRYDGKRF